MSWRVLFVLALIPFLIGADTVTVRAERKAWADFLEEWLYGETAETEIDLDDDLMRIDELQDRIFAAQAAARQATIFFPSGSAALDEESELSLQRFARTASSLPGVRFHLAGHSDSVPIHTRFRSNQELSRARAEAARRYLMSEGVASNQLTVAGYADAYPIAPNDRIGRAQNRRVEVHFLPSALSPPGR